MEINYCYIETLLYYNKVKKTLINTLVKVR